MTRKRCFRSSELARRRNDRGDDSKTDSLKGANMSKAADAEY